MGPGRVVQVWGVEVGESEGESGRERRDSGGVEMVGGIGGLSDQAAAYILTLGSLRLP